MGGRKGPSEEGRGVQRAATVQAYDIHLKMSLWNVPPCTTTIHQYRTKTKLVDTNFLFFFWWKYQVTSRNSSSEVPLKLLLKIPGKAGLIDSSWKSWVRGGRGQGSRRPLRTPQLVSRNSATRFSPTATPGSWTQSSFPFMGRAVSTGPQLLCRCLMICVMWGQAERSSPSQALITWSFWRGMNALSPPFHAYLTWHPSAYPRMAVWMTYLPMMTSCHDVKWLAPSVNW